MNRKIHIEKIHIRLKNVSPGKARDVGSNLGGEILRQVVEHTRHNVGTRQIEKLDAGRIKSSREMSASEIQNQVARKIVDLIGERVG